MRGDRVPCRTDTTTKRIFQRVVKSADWNKIVSISALRLHERKKVREGDIVKAILIEFVAKNKITLKAAGFQRGKVELREPFLVRTASNGCVVFVGIQESF